jgi:hypothetical protein
MMLNHLLLPLRSGPIILGAPAASQLPHPRRRMTRRAPGTRRSRGETDRHSKIIAMKILGALPSAHFLLCDFYNLYYYIFYLMALIICLTL